MTLSTHPHLLYVHPYASGPFPFRVVVYLAEKQISETAVKVVPRTEDETANAFPSMPTGLRPILGIPKDDGSFVGTKPESYTWLSQSSIIIEYLEDLCDSNPDISPVPSLRGGGNLVEQAQIRSVGALVVRIICTSLSLSAHQRARTRSLKRLAWLRHLPTRTFQAKNTSASITSKLLASR